MVTLPVLEVDVEFRLMNGHDEKKIVKGMEKDQKSKDGEHNISRQLQTMIVSVAGFTDTDSINLVISNMPQWILGIFESAYKTLPIPSLPHRHLSARLANTPKTWRCDDSGLFWPDS